MYSLRIAFFTPFLPPSILRDFLFVCVFVKIKNLLENLVGYSLVHYSVPEHLQGEIPLLFPGTFTR